MRAILFVLAGMVVGACTPSNVPEGGDDDDVPPDGDGGPSGGDGGGGGGADGNYPDEGPIDFTNNLLPSPMPPGNLKPADAPMIIAFGWDDIAFTGDHANDLATAPDNGMNFIAATFGNITNPDGSKGSITFYQNGAYLPNTEAGGPWGSETNLMQAAGMELVAKGFEVGNHTFDHLEINATWGAIPPAWKMGSLGGWTASVGTLMDKASWLNPVISVNDTLLRQKYGLSQPKLFGFRAPRLEINDSGLNALADFGYVYDVSLEDGQQWEYVTAAVKPGTDTAGFKWVVWPHTLDNGSPGTWQSQDFGEKAYLANLPRGLWEVPVYMLYIPDDGLQQTLATRMKTEITSEDTSWIGDRVREITAFDFNTFLYARMRKAEWVKVMKYNFLLRYNGNRAPLTFGAHPEQFSARYDAEVLSQANNADFQDVLNYNRFSDRKAAVKEFVQWVKQNYPDDVYFMSGKQLVDYMKAPFDKHGDPVPADTLATPTVNDAFVKMSAWAVTRDDLGSDATVTVVDHNTMTVDFKVGTKNEAAGLYPFVDVATHFGAGSLAGVSHIDIVYETSAPIRVRLLTDEATGPLSMQVELAGTGGERAARIRVKDFRPDNYADPVKIAAAGFVDAAYMAKVTGLSFESASTKDNTTFQLKIKRIVVHGLGEVTAGKPGVPRVRPAWMRPGLRGRGSSVHWPAHQCSQAHTLR